MFKIDAKNNKINPIEAVSFSAFEFQERKHLPTVKTTLENHKSPDSGDEN
ncbi:MAG: hypothetical protein ACNYPF_02255 [Candidatus Puniceispirillales bacterium WSBS_2018_MAG_OTU23]